jgi:hypothetical protein
LINVHLTGWWIIVGSLINVNLAGLGVRVAFVVKGCSSEAFSLYFIYFTLLLWVIFLSFSLLTLSCFISSILFESFSLLIACLIL